MMNRKQLIAGMLVIAMVLSTTVAVGAFAGAQTSDSNDVGPPVESMSGGFAQMGSEQHVMELLAETHVDNEHACLHGEYDDRIRLDAGGSVETAPTVGETHKIWEVTYTQNAGYVVFDTSNYPHDNTFVFYTANGTVQPLEGTVVKRGDVPECDSLDEYVVIKPEDGQIALKLNANSDESDTGTPESTPTATPEPTPTATPETATATPAPTSTPKPTETTTTVDNSGNESGTNDSTDNNEHAHDHEHEHAHDHEHEHTHDHEHEHTHDHEHEHTHDHEHEHTHDHEHEHAHDTNADGETVAESEHEGASYYQVDFVATDPIKNLRGPEGTYADSHLIRFVHGSSEEPVMRRAPGVLAYAENTELNERIESHEITVENGTATITFTVAEGSESVELSLVSYTKPGPGWSPQTEHLQGFVDADTGTFSSGTYTLTVDLPDEDTDSTD